MIRTIYGNTPNIAKTVKIFEPANIFGNVSIDEHCSLYPGVTIRAEGDTRVEIGARTNLQEHVTVHTQTDCPVSIGEDVTVGHGAILHGCSIASHCLVGMGAIVQNGAKMEPYSMVGAGAVVPENMTIPSGYLAYGVPARVIRPLTEEERRHIDESAAEYLEFAKEYEKNE